MRRKLKAKQNTKNNGRQKAREERKEGYREVKLLRHTERECGKRMERMERDNEIMCKDNNANDAWRR